MKVFDFHRRSSGVLMHMTSLAGPHGCGDLGVAAFAFIDFLAQARQTWWQMLPVGPPGGPPGYSPYDSPSAFAGSPWLVSLHALARQGFLARSELKPRRTLPASRVNFPATWRFREPRLRAAFAAFRRRRGEQSRHFLEFCARNANWLEDFALFTAIRQFTRRPWTEWESGIRQREPSAVRQAQEKLADAIAEQRFVQFQFDCQWHALRTFAHRRGVGLIGDLPVFVGHDSADVWSQPELFQLDRHGRPRRVSGYPPDRCNRKGQRWGHPQYDWPTHEQTGFGWWLRRFSRVFELFDAVRVDHFLGFTRVWSISARAASARSGRWVKSPGFKLFAALRQKLGPRPMIAEDLGHVTAADVRLRDTFGLAPMRILQFAFDAEPDAAEHLPRNYAPLCAAYTGNHDHNTIVGWFRERKLAPAQEQLALHYLGDAPALVNTKAIRAVMASRANLVLFPTQDVLGLDHRARMNVPGTAEGNWHWRLASAKLTAAARDLRRLTEASGRNGVSKVVQRARARKAGAGPEPIEGGALS